MLRPIEKVPGSRAFLLLRAAYFAAVAWSAGTLAVAWSVWIPGKGRPGTYFARETFPTVLSLSFWLFVGGVFWSCRSPRAYDSVCVKWCVYIVFAVTVLAQLFELHGR